MRYFGLIISFILTINLCFGQESRFQQITTDQGLSQNSVIDILEDKQGYIWMATQDGLNKFNGREFTIYKEYFKDITKEDHAALGMLYMDFNGVIWINNQQGEHKYYDSLKDQFIKIEGATNISSMAAINNKLYAGSYDGSFYEINLINEVYETTLLLNTDPIYHLCKDKNKLYLATNNGVKKYTPNSLSLQKGPKEFNNIPISKIVFYKEDQFLISTFGQGLFISNLTQSINKIKGLPTDLTINDMLVDHQKNIWIACFGTGAYHIDPKEQISHFEYDASNPSTINYKDILSLYQDSHNDIWLGTDGGGASIYSQNYNSLQSITNKLTPEQIYVDVPRAIAVDDQNRFWIGTSGHGLSMVDISTGTTLSISSATHDLDSDRIVSLYFDDRHNRIWIGTQDGGLYNYHLENKKLSKRIDIPCQTIWNLNAINKDDLLIGSRDHGLFLFNLDDFSWKSIPLHAPDSNKPLKNIRTTFIDVNKDIYGGTDQGQIFKINNLDGKQEFLKPKINGNNELSGPIKCLLKKDEILWVGTQNHGLLSYDFHTKKTRQWDRLKGLPNDVIYGIQNDKQGDFWISTNKGICELSYTALLSNQKDYLLRHLTKRNGLVSNEFNTGAYCTDKNGNLFFGGIDGINWFNPDKVSKNNAHKNVVFEEMILNDGTSQSLVSLSNRKKIILDHKQKNFQIAYTTLDYPSNDQHLYQYKLDPIQDEWVFNGNSLLASFTNIEPGDYQFKIRATNQNNVWMETSSDLTIEIIPAFWQTLAFKILSILVFLSLFYFIIWSILRETKRKTILEQRIKLSEAVALRAQMNPHFLFNSLNSIDNYILNNKPKEASEYLSKFSKLIRRILDYSAENRISLKEELNLLKLYVELEKMRFSKHFNFHFKVDKHILLEEVKIPPMLLQPFVENAIWHGIMHAPGAGQLDIYVKTDQENFVFEIEDNGIGREKSEMIKSKSNTLKKSHGMKITEERVRLNNELYGMGGKIKTIDKKDEFGSSTGTKVIIQIPKNAST